jgi:hypothetical protein
LNNVYIEDAIRSNVIFLEKLRSDFDIVGRSSMNEILWR